MGSISLGNLVGVLASCDPESLRSIQTVIPNARVWLTESTDNTKWRQIFDTNDPKQIEAILHMTHLSLALFQPLVDKAIETTRKQISITRWLEMIGKVMSAMGAGGTIALLSNQSHVDKALITSAISLIGAMVSIFIKFLSEDMNGTEKGVGKLFSSFKDYGWKIRVCLAKITVLEEQKKSSFSESDFNAILQASELAGLIYHDLASAGVKLKVDP
jgi:hypothetical protein